MALGVLEGILAAQHQVVGFFPWEVRAKTTLKTRLKRLLLPTRLPGGVPLLNFPSANDLDFCQYAKSLSPDLLVVAGWGEILSPPTIALPRQACINVHPSLLPRHRGASPIASVLREGESLTGVTFHYLTARIDAGDILYQSEFPIYPSDDYSKLARRIAFRARESVGMALEKMSQHAGATGSSRAQDESLASYFGRLAPADLFLDWTQSAEYLRNRIRSASPPSYFRCFHRTAFHRMALHRVALHRVAAHRGAGTGGTVLQVIEADYVDLLRPQTEPGVVIAKSGAQLMVSTGDPLRALFIRAAPAEGKLGVLGAKLYCRNEVHIGDRLTQT